MDNIPEEEKSLGKDNRQKAIPEAVSSMTLSVMTPKGFPALFTLRDTTGTSLLEKMALVEGDLLSRGYEPQKPRSSGFGGGFPPKKPIETVPGRACPKCGSTLVYSDTKKGQAIKCSTSKYDWTTKTPSGCSFFEWVTAIKPVVAEATPAKDVPFSSDDEFNQF